MTALLFVLACLLGAVVLSRTLPALRGWPPALGLIVAGVTVVPPHWTLGFGIGADDVLFLIGIGLLTHRAVADGPLGRSIADLPYRRWLALGAGLLIAGMTISAFVNGEDPASTVSLLVRGPGRIVLYALAVVVVFAQQPGAKVRSTVARILVLIGTGESVLGVLAYLVGLVVGGPVYGLEEATGNTSLLGEIPGRVIGTFDLSSNFLGALLTLTIPVSLGLALGAASRISGPIRMRSPVVGWAAATVVQLVAIVFTYTRASLGLTLLACAVLLVLRARTRWLLIGAAAVAALLIATPAGERMLVDQNDRLALYTSALMVYADHPVAGVGPGEQADVTAADPDRYRKTPFGVAGSNAHNTVLLAAAENGTLGLLGALILNVAFGTIAVVLIRRNRRPAPDPAPDGEAGPDAAADRAECLGIGVAILAFLAQGMVNNLFTVTLTATFLVLLVAGCALPALAERRPE